MQIILLFDENNIGPCGKWHCGKFKGSSPIDKFSFRARAFKMASEMIHSFWHEGDRLLVASFADELRLHGGWIDTPEEALELLEALESQPVEFFHRNPGESPRTSGLFLTADPDHPRPWIENTLPVFLDTLGHFQGRKELFFLSGCPSEGLGGYSRLQELAALAQANQVALHAVDIQGLGNRDGVVPPAFGTLSRSLGGSPVTGGRTLGATVDHLHQIQECRFRLYFRPEAGDSRNGPPRLVLRVLQPGWEIQHPVSYRDPGLPPAPESLRAARFLMPRWEKGFRLDASVMDFHRSTEDGRWKGNLEGSIRFLPEEAGPSLPRNLTLEAYVFQKGKILRHFKKIFPPQDLNLLTCTDAQKKFRLPLDLPDERARIFVAVESENPYLGATQHLTLSGKRDSSPNPASIAFGKTKRGRGPTIPKTMPPPELVVITSETASRQSRK